MNSRETVLIVHRRLSQAGKKIKPLSHDPSYLQIKVPSKTTRVGRSEQTSAINQPFTHHSNVDSTTTDWRDEPPEASFNTQLTTTNTIDLVTKRNEKNKQKTYDDVSKINQKSKENDNQMHFQENHGKKASVERTKSIGSLCKCCYPFTPLCVGLSVLGLALLAAMIAALIVGLAALPGKTTKAMTTTGPNSCDNCSIPVNWSIPVNCTPPCLNGGICTLPNYTCSCNEEVWTGSQCQTPVRILWTFDNHLLDHYGNFPGTPVNNPTYQTPGINGFGSCLYLNASGNQSVTILSPPFLNMAHTSFSLSAWVRANSFRNSGSCSDNAIFGQFDQNTKSHSLHIIVRNRRIYLGFFSDDTVGDMVLDPQTWYHMAYVYDYTTRSQLVYVNGILDQVNSPRGPYQGSVGNLTIGTNGVCAPSNTWDGCLDQITYFARAKSAAEVLRDATLVVSYTFNNTLIDDGPLGINGTGTNIQYSNQGRVAAALILSVNPSFVQATGLVYLGIDGYSFSISIWIKPFNATNGTIIHVSRSSGTPSWSMPMLGFRDTGQIEAQICDTSGTISLTGPVITPNIWRHVAITYSSTNRFRLWISGVQHAVSSNNFTRLAIDAPVTIRLGSFLTISPGICASTNIVADQYFGLIDEFQLYSRELSANEILNLAT